MVTITLVDNGADRYTLEASDFCLGRRYDNNAEKIFVVKPSAEVGHACTMIVTHNGQGVDRISVGEIPVDIENILSQYESVEIGFCFTGENDYLKNSEIKTFYFGDAQSPEDFTPVDPEIETDLLYVIANALVGLGLSSNTLQARNKAGAVTSSVDLTAFKNTNIKFGNEVIDNVNINDFASGINMSLDPTNYKLTVTLVDGNDVVLSTQTVDLPSENAIVDARLSQDGKEITFILQSGNTFDVDVSSIVSGLIPDTRKVAGLRLNQDISASDLRTALNVENGASAFNEDNIIAGSNVTITKSGKNVTINSTSGGTQDYSDLTNKPSINNTTLSGNKTSSDLGLQPTIDSSHKLDADLVQDGTTNKVYTATEQTKLSGIESGAQVNTVASVNTKTGSVVLDADDISDTNTTNKFVTASDKETWNGKQDTTDNSLTTTSDSIVGAINEVNSIAKGANQALSYANYSSMITAFNALASDVYNVGQNVMIVTLDVPDLWISSIEETSVTYTYTTDSAFTTALATNGYVQVGYYKLSALENQKVDLTNYVTKTDYATSVNAGVVKTGSNLGILINQNGNPYIDYAQNADIDAKTSYRKPIVPAQLDYAIEKGLGNNQNTWTDTEKSNARSTIGAVGFADYATTSTSGVVIPYTTYGTTIITTEGATKGRLATYPASSTEIDNRTSSSTPHTQINANNCKPIVPATLDYAVKVGVTTNTNTLTDTEKTNACAWLGTGKVVTISQADYDALVSGGTVDSNTYYFIEEE